VYAIRHYLSADEKDVYLDWLRKQRGITARIAIDRRVNRVEQGGHKSALANIGKTGKGEQAMKDRPHDEAMAEVYREDLAYALQLLNSILEDGGQSELLMALRQMTKAFGGVQAVAEQAHLNPTQLYRTLSPDGNPALSSFSAILKAMGMRLSVQPIHVSTAHA